MGAASGPQAPRNSAGCYPRLVSLRKTWPTPAEFRLCSNGRGERHYAALLRLRIMRDAPRLVH